MSPLAIWLASLQEEAERRACENTAGVRPFAGQPEAPHKKQIRQHLALRLEPLELGEHIFPLFKPPSLWCSVTAALCKLILPLITQ